MIPGSSMYHVVEAMAPLYTAAVLGYVSVRWLKIFSDEQCAGINHFVALHALPVLIFHMVSTNDPYRVNHRLIAADTLQKVLILVGLMALALIRSRFFRNRASRSPLKWVVTSFSVATLTNTIIMGVPLLHGMYGPYGDVSGDLMKQIVVLQYGFWYNAVIFFYEFMAAQEVSAKVNPGAPDVNGAEQSHHPHDTVTVNIEATTVVAGDSNGAAGEKVNKELVSAGAEEEEALKVVPVKQTPLVMHVLQKAGKRLLKVPNTYASILGLIWSLIAFKVGIKMPKIVDDSLSTIYTTAVGLSMFSSGLNLVSLAELFEGQPGPRPPLG